ncbi:hypothetical protein [Thiocapsa sp. N5-Cardenillas]|uniref:hypothetical protein n=1 Tax=Thiocapsa sp. N5-Cardenillas TaxID=3137397 RepID=UPI0035B2F8B1
MNIEITEDMAVSDDVDLGFMDTLSAAANTARLLESAGLELELTDEDLDEAAATARQAARSPQALQTKQSISSITKKTPAALVLTEKILNDYGHKIVQEAAQVRNMVVNKLVQETENPDARIRIKALELLGKVSDVGLFTEKQEITVTHQTSDDLRARLRQKLEKMIDVTPTEDADFYEVNQEGSEE